MLPRSESWPSPPSATGGTACSPGSRCGASMRGCRSLSPGRAILAVGLGAPDSGYEEFGEVIDRRVRAELLDEGLSIIKGLWHGQPFRFRGVHYEIEPTTFPTIGHTHQQPRVTIWCV